MWAAILDAVKRRSCFARPVHNWQLLAAPTIAAAVAIVMWLLNPQWCSNGYSLARPRDRHHSFRQLGWWPRSEINRAREPVNGGADRSAQDTKQESESCHGLVYLFDRVIDAETMESGKQSTMNASKGQLSAINITHSVSPVLRDCGRLTSTLAASTQCLQHQVDK